MDDAASESGISVVIGRFQPLLHDDVTHLQHLMSAHSLVIVVLTGRGRARSTLHPFTFSERQSMLEDALKRSPGELMVFGARDSLYRPKHWAAVVQAKVTQVLRDLDIGPQTPVSVGFRDPPHSARREALFRTWARSDHYPDLSTDEDRFLTSYFAVDDPLGSAEAMEIVSFETVPETGSFLAQFAMGDAFPPLEQEIVEVMAYREAWAGAPYDPAFLTTDAIVIQGGHILLVRRGLHPGKGLLALPGGFVGSGEWLDEAVIRELREETGLDLERGPEQTSRRFFDHPTRSARGRTVTVACRYDLDGTADTLPPVTGGDDAAEALWLPLNALPYGEIYEDHYDILEVMAEMG